MELAASRKPGFSNCCDAAKATCHLFHLQTLCIHLNLAEEDSTDDQCFVAQIVVTLLNVAYQYCQWHLLNDCQAQSH